MHLKIGTTLNGGKYRIEQVLGQGGFGITYLAVDEHDNYFAIKEFFLKRENKREETGEVSDRTDGEFSGYYRNRFKKEAAHLETLNHPGIVKYIESFDENNTSYYVMEYIEGESLDKYATDRIIPIEDSVAIIKEVAGILKYLHDQNQLHLDLKPGNIMRRYKDGKVVLVDFGLSKNYTDDGHAETSISMNAQTEGYAPMEMTNSARTGNLLPRIDVYSLGATLYKLLTRLTPPLAVNVLNYHDDFIDAMKSCAIPQPLISFIERAMDPRANERIQNMDQFISELDDATSQMEGKNAEPEQEAHVEPELHDEPQSEVDEEEPQSDDNDEPIKGLSFIQAVKLCLTKKYCSFKGRASRSEFWYFLLFYLIVFLLTGCLINSVHPVFSILLLLFLLPLISVTVRRIHDIGYNIILFFKKRR